MKLSKHVRYLVRVRDYETVQVEVGAEISHHDLGYSDEEWANDEHTDLIKGLEDLLNQEVDRIAREELTIVAGWSEISPNLAEDYLSVEPHTSMQRNQHATTHKKIGANSASGRTVRRGAATKAAKKSA